MHSFWKRLAALVLTLGLVGCPSPPKQLPTIIPLLPPPTAAPATTAKPRHPPAGPAANLSALRSVNGWVSCRDWSRQLGWENPWLIHHSVDPTYLLKTPQGNFVFIVGSRTATWNGGEFALGFFPKLIGGEPFLHSLDLAKSFEPLLGPLGCATPRGMIVIDPGHGGDNTGTHSIFNQHYEKEFTLDWGLRLAPLLRREGWTVVLTRTNDVSLSLIERVALAEQLRAGLFISLHFNSSAGPSGPADHGGLETYCLTPVGMPSNLRREFDDDPAQVFPNNAFDPDNFRLAMRVQQSLVRATSERDRGVRRARFMGVLRGQNRPAVLVEGGFLSDPHDARLIETANFRERLAQGVARALN